MSYGPARLDIYPTSVRCNAPLLLFVHGGGWCCGNKTQVNTNVIDWTNAQGYVFVGVDYRLNVTYPTFDQDLAVAVAWLRTNAASFGGDGSRIAIMGHSTGGSMVAELATTPSLFTGTGASTSNVDCVALLDASNLDIVGLMATASTGSAATIRRFYGDDPAGWANASAYANAANGSIVPRFLVVTRGSQSATHQRFAQRVRNQGAVTVTVNADSLGHGQVLNNIGRANDQVMTRPMQAFLKNCFG